MDCELLHIRRGGSLRLLSAAARSPSLSRRSLKILSAVANWLCAPSSVLYLSGALLLMSSALKVPDETIWRATAGDSRDVAVACVVCAEIVLGLWLLSGRLQSIARTAAVFAFGVFLVASLIKAAGGKESCGCFGSLSLPPWCAAVLDAALLVGLLRGKASPAPSGTALKARALFAFVAGVGMLAAWEGRGLIIALDDLPQSRRRHLEWVGAAPTFLSSSSDLGFLRTGRWRVFVYRHDCPACQRLVRELFNADDTDVDGRKLVWLELPPYAKLPITPRHQMNRRLPDAGGLALPAPLELSIDNGIITELHERESDGISKQRVLAPPSLSAF